MRKRLIPKTKEECFTLLDKELSEEDKFAISIAEDCSDFHFSLGMWIRNNWLRPMKEEDKKELMKQFVKPNEQLMIGLMCYDADMASSKIIESYQMYLRTNK